MIESLYKWWNKPNYLDFHTFFQHLYFLQTSGWSDHDSFLKMAEIHENEQIREASANIARCLLNGDNLALAFNKQAIFPHSVTASINAAEIAGKLDEIYDRLSEIMKLRHSIHSKLMAASISPLIALFIAGLLIIGFTQVIIPQMRSMYEDNGFVLEGTVVYLESTINAVFDYWYVTVVAIFLLYKLGLWFSENNKETIDYFKLKLPIYQKLHRLFLEFDLSTNLGMLLSSGVTFRDATSYLAPSMTNIHMAKALDRTGKEAVQGSRMDAAFARNNYYGIFSKIFISAISVGEDSAKLEEILKKHGELTEMKLNDCVPSIIAKFTLIIVVPTILTLGFLWLMLYLPIFDIFAKMSE